ncbi:hypothetical protein MIND_01136100 [Mycena indigotica]|uniref:Uncharacterized protein n=1 Tax=Mycena indigotica TaxID=2126181 RepID=A0A8H6S782_9AGAR|nr:uncharacterized protein MIND_01136100 [Mycena indigotica]KAF7293573.1 hypothetical protein MIND_01136100 [Mycena indigotica]
MGLAPYLVTTIDHIQDLQPDNFKKHYPLLKQFFLAVGAGWITQDEEPEPLSAANERIDSEVSYLILAKTHEDYRTKLTELSTASCPLEGTQGQLHHPYPLRQAHCLPTTHHH